MRHPMGNVVRNSGLLGDGGCNRFCVVVQACDAADDPIHILGDLLVDHLDGFDFFGNRLGKRGCAIGQIFDLTPRLKKDMLTGKRYELSRDEYAQLNVEE